MRNIKPVNNTMIHKCSKYRIALLCLPSKRALVMADSASLPASVEQLPLTTLLFAPRTPYLFFTPLKIDVAVFAESDTTWSVPAVYEHDSNHFMPCHIMLYIMHIYHLPCYVTPCCWFVLFNDTWSQ